MITIEQQKKAEKLIQNLIEKAWSSNEFKDQLIKSPELTIQEFTNKDFTMLENKKLYIEDQTDSSIIFLNIPSKQDHSNMELTDEQLEIVAGGEVMAVGWWVVVGVLCLAGGTGVGMALR